MRRLLLTLCVLLIAAPSFAGLPGGAGGKKAKNTSPYLTKQKKKLSAKKQFVQQTGYRKGRKGYVVDYIVPRSKGGMDHPSNMQWLRKADAKAKHKREHAQRW